MTLVFNGRRILQNPASGLKHFIKSTLRSSLFLTCYWYLTSFFLILDMPCYSTMAWAAPCTFRNMCNRDRRWMYLANGLLSGACVLLEAPSRRLEIALYVLPRALESLWKMSVKYGFVRNLPNGEVFLSFIYFINDAIETTTNKKRCCCLRLELRRA